MESENNNNDKDNPNNSQPLELNPQDLLKVKKMFEDIAHKLLDSFKNNSIKETRHN